MARKRTAKKRYEIQFFPQSTMNPIVVRLLGVVGAVALGAGMWEQFGAREPLEWTPYLLAGGASAFGAAIWTGTSGDLIVRVGQGGVGIDRAGVTSRIPWYQITKISWNEAQKAIVVKGDDEAGTPLIITVKVKSQPHAAAWIVDQAEERAAKALDVPDSAREQLPKTTAANGLEVSIDPVQVVGKRCAKSNKVIAYEPDGRVCPRCERINHKNSLPKKCACGQDLTALRHSIDGDGDESSEAADENDDEEDEAKKADDDDDDEDDAPPPPAKKKGSTSAEDAD